MHEQIEYLDGTRFRKSIIASARRISEMEEHLNAINVFPVPDGDTGTNMVFTMNSIAQGAEECCDESFDEISGAIADSAFVGARGNSGAILAQFFQGLAEATRGKVTLTTTAFAQAAVKAAEQARDAISMPCEGTIITVMKDWSHSLAEYAHHTSDFIELFRTSLGRAHDSLADTPNKLKELKRAGVVDAGAQGFVNLLEGMLDFIESGKIAVLKMGSHMARKMRDVGTVSSRSATGFRFCTEALVEGNDIDRASFRQELVPWGNSLIVVGSPRKVRFHIHTNEPEKVFSIARNYGDIVKTKIDDMHAQMQENMSKSPRIGIVTDSTCDLPPDVIAAHHIQVVPLMLQVGTESYRDRIDMDADEFYELMASSDASLSTSRPPHQVFREIYDRLAPHCEAVVSIHISEALSSTAEGARMSCHGRDYEDKIHVVNSRATTISLGLLVLEAARMIDAGLPVDDVVSRLEKLRHSLRLFVSIPDLTYGIRGGRISRTKGFMGKMLNLRPVISMDAEGRAERIAYAFGQKGVVAKTYDLACDFARTVRNPRFNVAHIGARNIAERYRRDLREQFAVEDVMINTASPVIGVHVGIGSAAIAVLGDAD